MVAKGNTRLADPRSLLSRERLRRALVQNGERQVGIGVRPIPLSVQRGVSTMIICRFSIRGICSTLVTGSISERIRSSTFMPMSWCAISRPRKRKVTFTLSPSSMNDFMARIFT